MTRPPATLHGRVRAPCRPEMVGRVVAACRPAVAAFEGRPFAGLPGWHWQQLRQQRLGGAAMGDVAAAWRLMCHPSITLLAAGAAAARTWAGRRNSRTRSHRAPPCAPTVVGMSMLVGWQQQA